MMDFTPLLTIIQQEQVLHEQLLKAKQDEQRFIATSNPNGLLNNTETLASLVEEIEELEAIRQQVIQSYAEQLGLSVQHPTLQELLEVIPPTYRQALEQGGEQLRQLVFAVQELNDANHLILERSVELFNHEIKQLTQPKESGVYTKTGTKDASPVARAGLNLRA